jgi:hypothetical protein
MLKPIGFNVLWATSFWQRFNIVLSFFFSAVKSEETGVIIE